MTGVCRAQVKHLLRAVVPRHVLWGAQSAAVFDALRGDFMSDVVSVVDELLAEGARFASTACTLRALAPYTIGSAS